MKFHLPFGIRINEKNSSYISREEYKELMDHARLHNVKLENFKRFSGDISLIKEMIDDISLIAQDFPMILNTRKSVVVRLDENSPEDDFATTDRHLISINAKIFNNRKYLENEYHMLSEMGKFVKGTNYRSVIRHELGHIVANVYHINPLSIAKEIFPEKSDFELSEYIFENISIYAADYKDGREFISECFSAYYGNVDIWFAKEYVNKCKEIIKGGSNNDKK